jgi:uncharacterized protein YdhG (YjbR/CyaY superfamily)
MKHAESVDEYIQDAPAEVQPKLQLLRKTIKALVPTAEEQISYGMPFYDYKGRLVYFANQSKFIGLYIPPPIIDNHKKELEEYVTTKSAIHFPISEDLPLALIKKLVNARVKWNNKTSKQ